MSMNDDLPWEDYEPDDPEHERWYYFRQVEVVAATSKALLIKFRHDPEPTWVPRSQMRPGTTVHRRGQVGTLVLHDWICGQKGLSGHADGYNSAHGSEGLDDTPAHDDWLPLPPGFGAAAGADDEDGGEDDDLPFGDNRPASTPPPLPAAKARARKPTVNLTVNCRLGGVNVAVTITPPRKRS